MGLAAGLSTALILCCLVSVAGKLHPGRKTLNLSMAATSLAVGLFVGVRSYHKEKIPKPVSRGRCPDCVPRTRLDG